MEYSVRAKIVPSSALFHRPAKWRWLPFWQCFGRGHTSQYGERVSTTDSCTSVLHSATKRCKYFTTQRSFHRQRHRNESIRRRAVYTHWSSAVSLPLTLLLTPTLIKGHLIKTRPGIPVWAHGQASNNQSNPERNKKFCRFHLAYDASSVYLQPSVHVMLLLGGNKGAGYGDNSPAFEAVALFPVLVGVVRSSLCTG